MLKTTTSMASTGTSLKATQNLNFLIPDAILAVTRLRLAITKTLIFHYFDTDSHIRFETNTYSYAISSVISQFIFDFQEWYAILFFS